MVISRALTIGVFLFQLYESLFNIRLPSSFTSLNTRKPRMMAEGRKQRDKPSIGRAVSSNTKLSILDFGSSSSKVLEQEGGSSRGRAAPSKTSYSTDYPYAYSAGSSFYESSSSRGGEAPLVSNSSKVEEESREYEKPINLNLDQEHRVKHGIWEGFCDFCKGVGKVITKVALPVIVSAASAMFGDVTGVISSVCSGICSFFNW